MLLPLLRLHPYQRTVWSNYRLYTVFTISNTPGGLQNGPLNPHGTQRTELEIKNEPSKDKQKEKKKFHLAHVR